MNLNINWKNPKEVKSTIKTLELTHPYETAYDDENKEHIDNFKYLKAKLPDETPVAITLFRKTTKDNPEKITIETATHSISFDENGYEIDGDNNE